MSHSLNLAEPSRRIAPDPAGGRCCVLVTGASGFVGSALTARLIQDGDEVHGLGRRAVDRPGYFQHDLTKPLTPGSFPAFDVVVHAAARASPWGTSRQFFAQNVLATEHVLNYCREQHRRGHGLPKLVFISSSSVYYAPCDQLGITEDTPFPEPPINRYAQTKRLGEALVQAYEGPWVVLRPRAVFGPGDTVLLPRVLRAARAGKLPLLTRRDRETVGDLIYIDNLIDYIVAAMRNPDVSGSFNLTNDQPIGVYAFLFDVLDRLGVARPRKRVSVASAMRAAAVIEAVYNVFLPRVEPPITRFGVHVFAYSKTFDVSRSIAAMGRPRIDMAEGVRRTVEALTTLESHDSDGER